MYIQAFQIWPSLSSHDAKTHLDPSIVNYASSQTEFTIGNASSLFLGLVNLFLQNQITHHLLYKNTS